MSTDLLTVPATAPVVTEQPARPRWSRPALAAVLVLAAGLYTWALSINGYANTFYAAAVLGETQSWKAFFFGALDAGSAVTVDKPPLALWVQALSARAFGFNSWSLLLPQAVAGVLTVAVLHLVVRRTYGHLAAIIAALVFTLTPITVAITRHNNPDTLLVLLLVLAAWACSNAVRSGRWLPMVWCALAVGLAFNTKMLQAYLVLPAFGLAYLVAAPNRLRSRIAGLGIASAVLLAVSASWMLVVDAIPAADRPYIDGSLDNTVSDLVFGYNGLGRVLGQTGFASPGLMGGGGGRMPNFPAGAMPRGGGGFGGDQSGLGRLFSSQVGSQISWLLPLAAIGGLVALALAWRARRTDQRRAGLIIWGGWLLTTFVVFSFAQGIWHPYYTTALAPELAAVVGIGLVALIRLYRTATPWALLLPVALGITGFWGVALLDRNTSFVPWLVPVVAMTTSAVVVALVLGLIIPAVTPVVRQRILAASVVAGLLAVLAGPSAYAASTVDTPVSSTFPAAGPAGAGFGGFGQGSSGLPTALANYLVANQGKATWIVAMVGSAAASPVILQTGKPVIAIGGYNGNVPVPTAAQMSSLVASGQLRFLLDSNTEVRSVSGDPVQAFVPEAVQWARTHCKVVTPSAYGSAPTGSTLYDCS
ncbi:glycosyltransferase family 39 protein [Kutzneria albida]|uniref:Uncharacterized protein n=1 Tax=Kutzneria albida DSM 43870 TaxID=1449976 RepID=W5WEX9_9PSEU|nr:glycosyltransferase family 39 protein [Kutzneria albida]AHH99763.1 hypothetical protein KALB_6404 [Kutzneria albida DSM 43870]